MIYKKCRVCTYLVTQQNVFCPDCGAHRPYNTHSEIKNWAISTTHVENEIMVFLLVCFLLFVGIGVYIFIYLGFPTMVAIIGGIISSLLLSLLIFSSCIESEAQEKIKLCSTDCLQTTEKKIRSEIEYNNMQKIQLEGLLNEQLKKLGEANKELIKLQTSSIKISQNITNNYTNSIKEREMACDNLKAGIEIIKSKQKWNRIQLWELERIRWENKGEQLEIETLTQLHLTQENHEQLDKQLLKLYSDGNNLIDTWSKKVNLSSRKEGEQLITNVKEKLVEINIWRCKLDQERVRIGLANIDPLQNAQSNLAINLSLSSTQLFNTSQVIQSFHSTFQNMQDEYARLQKDLKSAQQLGII